MTGAARCRICAADLEPRFALPVLHGRHTAQYAECIACHSLQVVNPTWLDEAYAVDPTGARADPDTARFRRNFSALRYVTALIDGLVIPSPPTLLDFGSGTGLLTSMLLSAGFEAWATDTYAGEALLAPGRSLPLGQPERMPQFDCITALEVFEHLSEPLDLGAQLRQLLRPGGCLVVSTALYRSDAHGPDWPYLSTEWGQHVTFWTHEAFLAYARELDYRSVGYFPGGDGFLIVLSTKSDRELADGLAAAERSLASPVLLKATTDAWDFRGDVFAPAPSRVFDAGGNPC